MITESRRSDRPTKHYGAAGIRLNFPPTRHFARLGGQAFHVKHFERSPLVLIRCDVLDHCVT